MSSDSSVVTQVQQGGGYDQGPGVRIPSPLYTRQKLAQQQQQNKQDDLGGVVVAVRKGSQNRQGSRSQNSPLETALLPPLAPEDRNKKTLVLDLDETLVHSSFKPIHNPDFIIPVEIENIIHRVYVLKRPGVDEFLKNMGPKFEIVVFTASLSKYADPLLDKLDIHNVVKARLFREACVNHCGNYVKDLSKLGRELRSCIIVDNSPHSYAFHPYNAIAIETWFDDPNDTQLYELQAFLESLIDVEDVATVLDATRTMQQQ